jgi:hypothetical protein
MDLTHRWPTTPALDFPPVAGAAADRAGRENVWDRAWCFFDWVMWAPAHGVGHRILRIIALGAIVILVPLLSPLMLAALAATPIVDGTGCVMTWYANRVPRRASHNLSRTRAGQRPFDVLHSRRGNRRQEHFRSTVKQAAKGPGRTDVRVPKLASA